MSPIDSSSIIQQPSNNPFNVYTLDLEGRHYVVQGGLTNILVEVNQDQTITVSIIKDGIKILIPSELLEQAFDINLGPNPISATTVTVQIDLTQYKYVDINGVLTVVQLKVPN